MRSDEASRETPTARDLFKASRVVTGIELKVAIGLLIFSAVVPIATILWWGRPATFAEFVSVVFLGLFMFAVLTTFAIIVLWGLGRLDLPGKFVGWLGVVTVGEIVGLLLFMLDRVRD